MAAKTIHEVQIGLIKVSVFRTGRVGNVRYNFKLERLFRDGDVWRKSTRLCTDDLLVASKALDMAYEWTDEQKQL